MLYLTQNLEITIIQWKRTWDVSSKTKKQVLSNTNLEDNFSTVIEETVHNIDGALVGHDADEERQEPGEGDHLHHAELV